MAWSAEAVLAAATGWLPEVGVVAAASGAVPANAEVIVCATISATAAEVFFTFTQPP